MKKISYFLILIGMESLFFLLLKSYNQIKENNNIVNQIIFQEQIPEYYLGYIEINSLKIPLVYGTTDKELDQNLVGISEYSTKEHLILAGHAIPSVFQCLYYISINEKIIIHKNNDSYTYYVDYYYITDSKDLSVYKNSGLTLITCINQNKRLIIHAKTA